MKNINSILYVPDEIKSKYIDISRNKNHKILVFLAIAGLFIQSFNIFRVLVLTNAKLSTLNNRIYFSFYLFMFVIGSLYLVSQIFISDKKKLIYTIDTVCLSIFMFWNVGLTMYDTYRAEFLQPSVFIVCLMFFGALVVHHPYFTVTNLIISYLMFSVMTLYFKDTGALLNVTIAVILSIYMVINRYLSVVAELKQKQNVIDINEILKKEENKFRLTSEQYDVLLKYTKDIMFVWNLKNDFIKFSDNWSEMLGLPTNIQNFTGWIKENNGPNDKTHIYISEIKEELKRGNTQKEEEILIKSISGREMWFKMNILNQFDDSGYPVYGIGMLYDITSEKATIKVLKDEMKKDPLTGILNKTAIEKIVNSYIEKDEKTGVMLVMDIDDFKNINDKYSHLCGDYVLVECANILKSVFRDNAEVGRIGGDEFAVFIRKISDEALYEACNLVIGKMKEIYWQGTCLNIRSSIGASKLKEDTEEYKQVYYKADEAMYIAKRTGKGRICFDWENRQTTKN